jgi:imidazolonepropionase-like amidohydrolase
MPYGTVQGGGLAGQNSRVGSHGTRIIGNWIKTMNTGGYMSAGDDPARVTWFEDEMLTLGKTAQQLGLPLAVHTGAAEGCKQAMRAGARSLEHCYLIDDEGIEMAEKAGTFLVPTMKREDKALLAAGKLPEQALWKFRRDVAAIEDAQRRIARSKAKVAMERIVACFRSARAYWNFRRWWRRALRPCVR